MKVAIRKYLGEFLISQEHAEMDGTEDSLVEGHMREMATGQIDCIEVEFVDDPDPKTRIFRIGTNTVRMRDPIQIDPDSETFIERWGKQ